LIIVFNFFINFPSLKLNEWKCIGWPRNESRRINAIQHTVNCHNLFILVQRDVVNGMDQNRKFTQRRIYRFLNDEFRKKSEPYLFCLINYSNIGATYEANRNNVDRVDGMSTLKCAIRTQVRSFRAVLD
jgi:hypothetical protein